MVARICCLPVAIVIGILLEVTASVYESFLSDCVINSVLVLCVCCLVAHSFCLLSFPSFLGLFSGYCNMAFSYTFEALSLLCLVPIQHTSPVTESSTSEPPVPAITSAPPIPIAIPPVSSAPSHPLVSDLDLPIALCKGGHSCYTHHLLHKFVTYSRLSPVHRTFVFILSSISIPNTVVEPLAHPRWRAAGEELRLLYVPSLIQFIP